MEVFEFANRLGHQIKVLMLAFAVMLSHNVLYAQWSNNSTENDSIVVHVGNQTKPTIISDTADGAIIVWQDARSDTSATDIYAARLHASGSLLWTPSGEPVAIAENDQKSPSIVEDGDGGAFIAWQDDRGFESFFNIYAQHIDHTFGQGQWQLNGVRVQEGNNLLPGITRDSIFGVLIASYSSFQTDFLIYVQKVNNSGVPQWDPFTQPSLEVRTPQPTSPPAIISDSKDGAIVVWPDRRNPNVLPEIYAARLDGGGEPAWTQPEVLVSSTITAGTEPVVIPDSGGVIISWIAPDEIGSTNDNILAQYINSQGQKMWGDNGRIVSETEGRKRNVRMVRADPNTIFILWEDLSTGPDWDISAQRIDSNGNLIGLEVEVVNVTGDQINPAVISNKRGSIVAAWEDNRNVATDMDIYAQLIELNGNVRWDVNGRAISTAPNLQKSPDLTDDGLGGAIIVWEDFRNGQNFDIYAQRVSAPGDLGEFRTITVSSPDGDENWEVASTQVITWTSKGEIDSVSIELSRNGGQNYFAEDIIDDSTPNTGTKIFQVEGPSSTNCKIRIRAVNADFILAESETFVISDSAGPAITLSDTVSVSTFGDSVLVRTSAVDNSGIQDIFLNFKKGGDLSFNSLPMNSTGPDSFEKAIPTEFVSERGVEYFVRSVDNIGITTNSDTFFITVNFDRGVQTSRVSGGSSQNAYRMISAPNDLDDPSVASIITASGFGAVDTTSWRIFKYQNVATGYVELDSTTFNDPNFAFEPGQAFWLISATGRTLDFGSGGSLSATTLYSLTIKRGWNQISTPFAFPVDWQAALDTTAALDPTFEVSSLSQQVNLYEGSYSMEDVLEPYKGYFVFNNGASDVTVMIPPVATTTTASKTLAKAKNSTEADWEIEINATCQEARDHFNFLGIHPKSSQSWDVLDYPEPPPIGQYVSVYFPRNEWLHPNNYTTDYRAKIGEGQTWSFEVQTNIPNSEARIEFLELQSLPRDAEVWLLDEKLDIKTNVRENNSYTFATGAYGTIKSLKLLIGEASYLAGELSEGSFVPTDFQLSQNFPNPFNPVTTIRFGLPQSETVRIKIYDILGREVKTLVNEQMKAGFHAVSWNGENDAGRAVGSGLYIYRIEAGDFSQSRKMMLIK
ncbi:T9SS type A sorting domain-containing protein [candidate division KSB1 bacterium]|nr:T9SS type A sorting domain-containing protein [candidate division KSB1 bacterium]NIR73321.1 T9SS type A sorting domain-containing protein [candidate division KSB1 bacterium]NIS27027.1 T9SS type A sorting domain-containing protein [candidate division KSB1 bacterium]NIT73867.1 T9SS type A sorting domain-containing protein [candidate division KSB1 bacterium]NIU27772.1 T9SS type A sorting domain-containing protein [candidate division KSB1 bacterium]